jgi:UDP-glucose 4-epimerase
LKIAILGASGFIGKNLASTLVLGGYDVTSFVRTVDPSVGVEFGNQVAFDFLNLRGISKLLNSFDSVVHLVSSSNPSSSSMGAISDAQQNLMSSIDLMEILKDNSRVRLVFASSGGAVYGAPNSIPITESHPTNPVSFYGVAKLAIEKYLYAYSVSSKLNYVVLRFSNPFGPHQVNTRGQGLIPTIIQSAVTTKPLSVWGDGTNLRDYLYIEDAVSAIVRAIHHVGGDKLFNVGSGIGRSVLELVSEIEKTEK